MYTKVTRQLLSVTIIQRRRDRLTDTNREGNITQTTTGTSKFVISRGIFPIIHNSQALILLRISTVIHFFTLDLNYFTE